MNRVVGGLWLLAALAVWRLPAVMGGSWRLGLVDALLVLAIGWFLVSGADRCRAEPEVERHGGERLPPGGAKSSDEGRHGALHGRL